MSESSYNEEMDEVREKIVLAALPHVTFDGWCLNALNMGARDAGHDEAMVMRVFPRELTQAATCWSLWADKQMLETLGALDLDSMKIRERISAGVKARLMVNDPHREALRRLLGWLILPFHASTAIKNTMTTVDEIWYAAGDRSHDWNYYSKRGLLAPVYTTTVLHWLADEPNDEGDYPDTWGYLDRRLDDVIKTFSLPKKLQAQFKKQAC